MNRIPFFSIIIPTYNRAHTLHRPIDSVLAQTYTDWELIIVDDGSTDDTQSVVEAYRDPRIRYVRQENKERSAARNHGMHKAIGEWICFQDSDDEYLPMHLATLKKNIDINSEFKIFRTWLYLYSGNRFLRNCTAAPSQYDQYPFECIQSFAFNRSVLRDKSWEEKYFNTEDLHFLLNVCQRYNVFIIEEFTGIYQFDLRASGLETIKCEELLLNKIACLNDILIWNQKLIMPFLTRQVCFSELKLLYCYGRSNYRKVFYAINRNIKSFIRYPSSYLKLLYALIFRESMV